MKKNLPIAALALSSGLMLSCKKDDDKDSTAEVSTSALSGTLSLNLVPSLNAAAGSSASASLAPTGTAPDFDALQSDYLTPSSKAALFGATSEKQNFCFNIVRTARALSKFLSNDSNLCIFKEVENARKAAKSWIAVSSGTVGDEGLFGQLSSDKKIKMTASTGDGSMDIFFDVKGSGGDSSANYELKMRQCQGGNLASLQIVTIERSTGKVTIEQQGYEDGQSPKADVFTGYLNSAGDAWDLTKDRDFAYDMLRMDSTPNVYEAVSTKFSDGKILTTTIEGSGNSQTRTIMASSVVGTSADNLSVQEAFSKNLADNSTNSMEFATSQYVSGGGTDLKALVDAQPTTGRYVEAQTSVGLPLLDGLDCSMESPDITGTIDLSVGQAEFDAACDSSLTDSQSETDADGNPVLRSGAYCSSL